MDVIRLHVYDFCDTIVLKQTHDDFILSYLLKKRMFLKLCTYLFYKNPISLILSKVFGFPIKPKLTYLLNGERVENLRDFSILYAARLRLYDNDEVLDLLKRQEDGIQKVVVSGGLSIYIQEYLKSLQLGFGVQVISNELVISDGIISGVFSEPDCLGAEKVRRINEIFPRALIDKSYSDSLTDLPLFRASKSSFFVGRTGKVSRFEENS